MTAQTYTDAQKLFALDAMCASGYVSEDRIAQAVAIYDSLPSEAARSFVVSDEDVLQAYVDYYGEPAWKFMSYKSGCLRNMRAALESFAQSHGVASIPMVLHCPACGVQHIDAPDDRTTGWDNPPHRSHLCHGCGHIWRPADVSTTGVADTHTHGKNDTPSHGVAGAVEPVEQHPDDHHVEMFADDMKRKLAAARAKGRGGWDGDEQGMQQRLSDMLRDHVLKGDPCDVANFCMFLHQRGEGILAGAVKVPDVAQLYEAASKGFHTSETCGTEGRYMHVAKFQTIEDLFAFEHAWTKVMVSARDAATQEKAS